MHPRRILPAGHGSKPTVPRPRTRWLLSGNDRLRPATGPRLRTGAMPSHGAAEVPTLSGREQWSLFEEQVDHATARAERGIAEEPHVIDRFADLRLLLVELFDPVLPSYAASSSFPSSFPTKRSSLASAELRSSAVNLGRSSSPSGPSSRMVHLAILSPMRLIRTSPPPACFALRKLICRKCMNHQKLRAQPPRRGLSLPRNGRPAQIRIRVRWFFRSRSLPWNYPTSSL
jgi:hypothetical protein